MLEPLKIEKWKSQGNKRMGTAVDFWNSYNTCKNGDYSTFEWTFRLNKALHSLTFKISAQNFTRRAVNYPLKFTISDSRIVIPFSLKFQPRANILIICKPLGVRSRHKSRASTGF